MQPSSVYLYPNRLDVYTNLSSWSQERYRKVYQRPLKAFVGSTNKIDFTVRNSDQKPKNIEGHSFVFNLVGRETQELILTKDCVVEDATLGRIYLQLTETELLDIEPGFYQWSLTSEARTIIDSTIHNVTERNPVYVDSQYGATSTIEILPSLQGQPLLSTEIKEFSYYADIIPENDFYVSGIIDASYNTSTPYSLHTFQLFFTGYTGDITLQASLDLGGAPHIWFDVDTVTLTNETQYYINATGKYKWFRFRHEPESGTFDKILYR
jgi:hypothetical protein